MDAGAKSSLVQTHRDSGEVGKKGGCWIPRAAIAKQCELTQFRRLQVQNHSVSRGQASAVVPWEECFLAFSSFWWLLAESVVLLGL